jgi:hypothetical protein
MIYFHFLATSLNLDYLYTKIIMAVSYLDLDVKLQGERIMASEQGAMLYIRLDEESKVTYSFAGDVVDVARALMSAMLNDEDGVLYEIVVAALDTFEESFTHHNVN